MKKFLRTSIFVSAVCFACTLSCRKSAEIIEVEKEITDSITPSIPNTGQMPDPAFLKRYIDVGFIDGEVSKAPMESPLLPWLKKELRPFNNGNLNLTGTNTPLLAFGDGMSSGWTDGGLYRAGQQTAFPNLVARQMALKDFKSPLFDLEHGNGTGYLVVNKTSSQPSWSEVSNNLAIISRSHVPELVPYLGGDVENMSEPKVDHAGISGTLSPKENGWIYGNDGRGWTEDMIFFWRMQPNADKYRDSYWDLLNKSLNSKKPAIVLSSFGFDLWTELNLKNKAEGMDWQNASSETSALAINVAELAQRSGAQGIVYTLPAFKHLAYYDWQK
ncbi:hypothetical protein [Dyadobacter sp. CY326]|uniref:hypothetical protein n=1 Tax=Dyadobacter sp. CY326 TaxID=2907300 RepID=UPI001F25DAFB|nr:hypothetical protein [Dyadobacter sp. CY326]MCE7067151.1 hypothetical protein [Dyadobacter sp. CY326]